MKCKRLNWRIKNQKRKKKLKCCRCKLARPPANTPSPEQAEEEPEESGMPTIQIGPFISATPVVHVRRWIGLAEPERQPPSENGWEWLRNFPRGRPSALAEQMSCWMNLGSLWSAPRIRQVESLRRIACAVEVAGCADLFPGILSCS